MSLWSRLRGRADWDDGRWIVLDVESSGLDAARDRLLAIAAIGVHFADGWPRIAIQDSFEVVLRHEGAVADKSNILLHGIGVGAQRQGVEPDTALEGFERWIGRSPLIAFHAAFDERMIQRAMQAHRGRKVANPWLDLAHVAEVAEPKQLARSLDEWLAVYGIGCAVRHQAAADTMATAELLLRLWPAVRPHLGGAGFAGLQKLAAQRRWLQRG